MTYIKQKHGRYKKKTNTKLPEMKTIISEMKISLDKIISRLHTAEEKIVTSESLAMETIQNETEIEKKERGKMRCFRH